MIARTPVALAACVFVACTGIDPAIRARDRAVEVLVCDEVEMTQLEEARFHARGCGREADIGCTAGALEPTCIQVASAGGEQPLHEREDDAPIDAGGPPQPVSATSAEATIRAGLDARRRDVFACTQRDPTIVRVTYDAAGALDIRLGAGLEGTPEEGCVRAALTGARAPTGEAGTVLHLVHGG